VGRIRSASSQTSFDKAFATPGQLKLNGLVVAPDAGFQRRRDQFVALAAQYAVPTIYYAREFVDAGGLVRNGTSFTWVYHQSAVYVARILKGEKPTDLPVMQPTKFELVINTKTARTLGLTVPQTLRAIADELIE
jgi:putative ABC transport system substrate-binding protein